MNKKLFISSFYINIIFFNNYIMSKIIFVIGGVISGIGKGIASASIATILKACGLGKLNKNGHQAIQVFQ